MENLIFCAVSTIFAKSSILDIWQASEYVSGMSWLANFMKQDHVSDFRAATDFS